MAHEALDLEAHAYYFVHRVVPEFGAHIVGFEGHAASAIARTQVTPFDTGSLVAGWTITAPPLGAAGMQQLVARHSYPIGDYEPIFDAWTTTAFNTPTDYVTAATMPKMHSVAEIVLPGPGDARTWSWEGRVQALDYGEPPMLAIRIVFAPGERNAYLDWVMDLGLEDQLAQSHVRHVSAISVESDTPARDMLDFLVGRV